MKLHELQRSLEQYPNSFPRFVLPDGDCIPAHAHITEIAHLVRTFIDCGGVPGKEERVLLQTHVGDDTDHRLRSERFSKILQLGTRVLPNSNLDVDVEYNCCVVAQYPITNLRPFGQYLDVILERGRTQCRPRERQKSKMADTCCATAAACCE
jgi:hypothetical protein